MGMDIAPLYGAPELVVVLANKEMPTYLYDGNLILGYAAKPANPAAPRKANYIYTV